MEGPEKQPDELNELQEVVGEFVRKMKNIENELDLLKEQQKDLVDEYKDKLDMKSLKAAMRAVKIKKKVAYKDTFDTFVDILEKYEDID